MFFRPWRDSGCSLPLLPRDESLGYCLSPSGLVRQGKISAEMLILMQHTSFEKRLYNESAAARGGTATGTTVTAGKREDVQPSVVP